MLKIGLFYERYLWRTFDKPKSLELLLSLNHLTKKNPEFETCIILIGLYNLTKSFENNFGVVRRMGRKICYKNFTEP